MLRARGYTIYDRSYASSVYVPLSCSGLSACSPCVFRQQPKAVGSPRYRFRVSYTDGRRSLVARDPSPCYGIACTLLHRVLVTAPTKDPSIFPQSRRKFSSRLYPLIVPDAPFVYRAQLSPELHKVPPYTHAIKPFFSRTPRRSTRSSLFLFVPHHIFANFRQRTYTRPSLRPSPYVPLWNMHCPEDNRRNSYLSRDDKYHVSSGRLDAGSLGLQRYFNPRADGRVIARTRYRALTLWAF